MSNKLNKILRYVILSVVGFVLIYPLLWLFFATFKENNEIFTTLSLWPEGGFDLSGYKEAWQTSTGRNFGFYFVNTLQILIPKVILTVISSVLTAYAVVRFEFKGKSIIFATIIATLLLPEVVLRIPTYLIWSKLGMLDTYVPLIAPSALAIDSFFIFMLIQFFRTLPTELDEAAKLDGCNPLQTLIYIFVPILKPAIISVALFTFMWGMNDFQGPLIYISSTDKYTLSLLLRLSQDADSVVNYGKVFAMSIMALLPSILIFFFTQRYFIEGIAATGGKE
ncbi:carbohydrate ABC transporter permease [Mollicutes bacterium LVI A0039]|nr:carbohydrate ABC transporter permease [Mollicutes bacterium LVI A0039]